MFMLPKRWTLSVLATSSAPNRPSDPQQKYHEIQLIILVTSWPFLQLLQWSKIPACTREISASNKWIAYVCFIKLCHAITASVWHPCLVFETSDICGPFPCIFNTIHPCSRHCGAGERANVRTNHPFDSKLLLEQNTEPQIAPASTIGVCKWVNERQIFKHFG